MNTKTNVKAGGQNLNHSETLRGGLKVQTHLRAGGIDTSPGRR